jgi:uncharacterized protein (TIGR02453 family)
MSFEGFDPSFFAFLKALKANNNREWFAEHKAQFERDVEAPARAFITDFAPHLKAISPRFIADARRVGGSMYRIHRDTRFSPDKTPFKTHIGLRFRHDVKEAESRPIFYLHLQPGESFGGGGIWHPDPVTLRKVRAHINDAPKEWKKVLDAKLEIGGDSLKRVPVGFPADHPFAEDLKRKDHVVMTTFTAKEMASPKFVTQFADVCADVAPLMKFLTSAMGLKW